MISFILKYKQGFIIGIAVVCICIYIAKLKYDVLSAEKSFSDAQIKITKLQNENDTLSDSLKKSIGELALKNSVIDGLTEKNTITVQSKNDEVLVGRKKYEYCISTKTKSTTTTSKIMDEETNKVYVDLYNDNIFK